MSNPLSPLHEYYPEHFEVDMNDKKRDYEAVVLLPFIDIARMRHQESLHCLSSSSSSSYNALTESEKNRNRVGHSYIYSLSSSREVLEEHCEAVIAPHEHCFEPVQRIGMMTSLPGYPSLNQLVLITRNNLSTGHASQPQRMQQKKKKSSRMARENVYQLATLQQGGINGLKWNHDGSIDSQHPDRVTIRFLLNDDTNVFLFELAEQIRLQAPSHHHDKHYDQHYEGTFKIPPGGHFIEYSFLLQLPNVVADDNRFNTKATTGQDFIETSSTPFEYIISPILPTNIQTNSSNNSNKSRIKVDLIDGVLNKLCDIFGTVKCQFVSLCAMDMKNGTVSVEFNDVSHLQQMEQFLEDRFQKITSGEGGGIFVKWNAVRQIVVGVYESIQQNGDGSNSGVDGGEVLAEWLGKEWAHLVKYLPVFGARVVEVWVDGAVRQYVLRGRDR